MAWQPKALLIQIGSYLVEPTKEHPGWDQNQGLLQTLRQYVCTFIYINIQVGKGWWHQPI